MTMRDGTKLAYATHPPTDVTNSLPPQLTLPIQSAQPDPSASPAPTLVEYSGYGYASPSGPVAGSRPSPT